MKKIIYNDNELSKLSLGTVQFGLDYGIANNSGKPNRKEVDDIINYVCDNDINCFDTAQAYGNSEQVLGESINDREDLYIISKLKSYLFTNDLFKNIDITLNNLKQQSLYGLLLHDSELLYQWKKEYTKLVSELINNHKIKYFGVSIYTDEDFELAINNDSIIFIQIPFNIFDLRAIHNNWLKKAQENNKLIFIRSVFLQGLFFMDTNNLPISLEKAKPYLIKFNHYCEELNMTQSELALAFVDTIAKDSLLLFGCDNVYQAKENIENYNNLKALNTEIIKNILGDFKEIDESIYNPTMWNIQ